MKKKNIIIISVLIIFISLIVLRFVFFNKKNVNEITSEERYKEIRESAKKAAEWHLKATQPYCVIGDSKEKKKYSHMNSRFLINNGYIKKEELLDIDGESYCDIYVRIYDRFEDELDHQHNCYVSYKLYLKCNGYEEKGYFDWGD